MGVYLLNRAPTKSLDEKTPYEAWHGELPDVHFLRTFGCVAHVRSARPNLKKLDDRSRPMVFFGYEEGAKAYRCYDPVNKSVHMTHDVIFDEDANWDWDNYASTSIGYLKAGDDFTVEYLVEPGAKNSGSDASTGSLAPTMAPSAVAHDEPPSAVPLAGGATTRQTEFVFPPPDASSHSPDEATPRYRTMKDLLDTMKVQELGRVADGRGE